MAECLSPSLMVETSRSSRRARSRSRVKTADIITICVVLTVFLAFTCGVVTSVVVNADEGQPPESVDDTRSARIATLTARVRYLERCVIAQKKRAERMRRAALQSAARYHTLERTLGPWRVATASTYFEAQSVAGPMGYYRGVGDTRHIVAHKSLPFGTNVRFQYAGRESVGVVMDRGPYVTGREWDLGWAVASELGFRCGVGQVSYRIEEPR